MNKRPLQPGTIIEFLGSQAKVIHDFYDPDSAFGSEYFSHIDVEIIPNHPDVKAKREYWLWRISNKECTIVSTPGE